jgi:hypothetical protein
MPESPELRRSARTLLIERGRVRSAHSSGGFLARIGGAPVSKAASRARGQNIRILADPEKDEENKSLQKIHQFQ